MHRVSDESKAWAGEKPVGHFSLWLVLWVVIDFAIITWILTFAPSGEAATTREAARDLATLQVSITMLNENARLPLEGQLVVKKRLSYHYDLTLGQVDGLLGRNMLYGDLAAVLEFAKEMPGGLKGANINKVIDLRQSGTGWDRIAENLRLDLSGITRAVSRFEEKTHSGIKKALVESSWEGGAGGGMEAGDR